MIENNRPVEEITEALELVEIDYKTVVEKHEALVERVDDEEFAKEDIDFVIQSERLYFEIKTGTGHPRHVRRKLYS
jgi:hypothetical protein